MNEGMNEEPGIRLRAVYLSYTLTLDGLGVYLCRDHAAAYLEPAPE